MDSVQVLQLDEAQETPENRVRVGEECRTVCESVDLPPKLVERVGSHARNNLIQQVSCGVDVAIHLVDGDGPSGRELQGLRKEVGSVVRLQGLHLLSLLH